jgi:predicted secreted acid phosphatase
MAHFKTGYLQKEQVLDVKVGAEMHVGDMCVLNTENNTLNKTLSLAQADYIIAQSDMTMEYGHVPVEKRNWAYSDVVAKSDSEKKVAVFFIIDESDIILDTTKNEVI